MLVYEENCLSVSKGVAYSALLSLFPVLTTITAILVQTKATPVLQVLSRFLSEVAPPGTEEMLLNRFAVQGEKPVSLLVIATLLSLYAASGLMLSLMEGFNGVYHVPTNRTFLRNRAVAALLVFSTALPAVGASVLILFGSRTERWIIAKLGDVPMSASFDEGVLLAGQLARYAVAFATVVLVTIVLYFVGTNRPQRWRQIWSGAVVSTVLWLAATQGFAWYVRNIAGYNFFYGSVGAVIALIVWMYLLAVITLYGCAYNAALERLRLAEAG
ncbi:MAG: YihY/virulence factor BrkB family protein [Acidobacteriia bacterium]|nr:YihY/virulence factor BrkB family protein [Terriglobia bacterium]